MPQPIFKKGDHREIRFANGQILTGFHSRMERRWEMLRVTFRGESYHAYYSRQTGRMDPDPEKSTILQADSGFLNSQLIDPRWNAGK